MGVVVRGGKFEGDSSLERHKYIVQTQRYTDTKIFRLKDIQAQRYTDTEIYRQTDRKILRQRDR